MDDNSTSKHNVVDYIGEAKDHFLKGRYNWSLGSESYQSNVLISRGRTVHGRNDEIVLFVLIQSSFRKPPFIGGFEYDLVKRQCCKQGFESLPTVQRIWDKVRNSNSGSGAEDVVLLEMNSVVRYKLILSESISVNLETDAVCLTDPSLVQILNGSLLRQLTYGGELLNRQLQNLWSIILGKDRVLQFLTDTIDDLGGTELIKKWAPVGSTNYECLKRADESMKDIEVPPADGRVYESSVGSFASKLLKLGCDASLSSEAHFTGSTNIWQRQSQQQSVPNSNSKYASYDSFEEAAQESQNSSTSEGSTDTDVPSTDVILSMESSERNRSNSASGASPPPKRRKFGRVIVSNRGKQQ